MPLFSRNKSAKVQSLILKLVNINCPSITLREEDIRKDRRINLSLAVAVIPLQNGVLQAKQMFTAVSREFSNEGLSLILDRPRGFHHAILGMRIDRDMVFLRAEAKHLSPMGGGFFQLGFQLLDTVSPEEFPELANVSL